MTATDITRSAPLVLVTGPTRGLGKDLTLALARRKVRLLLLGRDENSLSAVAQLAKQAGAIEVATVVADMGSFASVRRAAHEVSTLAETSGLVSAVVANAGVQLSNRSQRSVNGLEMTFAVNVVANHLLLSSIKESLAGDAHIVVVGSGTHFGDPITRLVVAAPRWEEPGKLAAAGGPDADSLKAGQCAYSTSKLGVNYLVHELNRRWGSPRRANIYDPGLMPGTGLARDLPRFKQWAWNNVMPALKVLPGVTSTSNSAERLARLTLGEEHATVSNAYIEIGKLSQASNESDDPQRERELWEFCELATSSEPTTLETSS